MIRRELSDILSYDVEANFFPVIQSLQRAAKLYFLRKDGGGFSSETSEDEKGKEPSLVRCHFSHKPPSPLVSTSSIITPSSHLSTHSNLSGDTPVHSKSNAPCLSLMSPTSQRPPLPPPLVSSNNSSSVLHSHYSGFYNGHEVC